LPRVIAGRRANYGIEGLALTPDGRSLVALLQGPLAASGGDARLTRLLFYDLATGGTRQYAYVHDQPGLSNTAVAALSADELLVVERDGGFEGDARAPARHKRIYRARVAGATDLGDPEDGPRGRLFRGKMPEGMSGKEREAAGIRPVARELLLDLLALPGGYPHDKPEGLAVLGPRMLALVNDDDFGITDEDGRLVPKRLPGRGNARDRNRVLFIALDADLWK
jgi:hypothetical protein